MGTEKEIGELTRAIIDEVRAERTRQRRTQQSVYQAAGLPRSTYLRLERCERSLDTEQLARIADALGVMGSDLVARAETALESRQDRVRKQLEAGVDPADLGLAAMRYVTQDEREEAERARHGGDVDIP